MKYSLYEPTRYTPTLKQAIEQGNADFTGISKYLPSKKDALILDVGCGSGNLVAALSRDGYLRVRGIDSTTELVEHGRLLLGVEITVNEWISYMHQDGEPFDVIVALDVLEHLKPEECRSALKATRNRMKRGGRLIIRTPNAHCPFVLPTFHGDTTHRLLLTPDLLEHLLREAGFSGPIVFWETHPHHRIKRWIWSAFHNIVFKPIFALVYFHFYQRFPKVITRNMYCCAFAD